MVSFVFFFTTSVSPDEKYQTHANGLLIKNVLKNDGGEYTCKAFQISPVVSNVKEKTIRLNIQRKCFLFIQMANIIYVLLYTLHGYLV